MWEGGSWVEIAEATRGATTLSELNADPTVLATSVTDNSVQTFITTKVNDGLPYPLINPPVGDIVRNQQTGAAWLVGADGFRRWIPTGTIYNCLATAEHHVEQRVDQFDVEAVPDRIGSWASCTSPGQPPPPPPPAGYGVVNADGGVYWRSAPDWNTAVRRSGYGVYTGDRVQLTCWVRGGTVPPYFNNPLWYQATVISGQGKGSGLVNDHFLNTGTNLPNIVVGGVPQCGPGASPPPPPSPPATPSGLSISSATEASLGLSWNAISGADNYVTYLNGGRLFAVSGTTYTFTGLACGTTYSLGVQAQNSTGVSAIATTSASTAQCSPVLVPAEKILYTTNAGGNYDIHVMNGDGTGDVNLTNNPAVDSGAAWSHDGSKIAFSSTRDAGTTFDLYVMNANGSGVTRLTSTPTVNDIAPSWSPDGAKIVYTRFDPVTHGAEIWTMNANGSNQTPLVQAVYDIFPQWSPDGTSIIFERDVGYQTQKINPDGTGLTNLTNNTAVIDINPVWSPDGSRIAFFSQAAGGGSGGPTIGLMNADGSSRSTLGASPANSGGYMSWAPCSRIITDNTADISVVKPNTGESQSILSVNPFGAVHLAYVSCWEP